MSLLQSLEETLASLLGPGAPAPFADDDLRLLSAVLLTEVALADGRLRPEETERARRFLADAFVLADDELDALLGQAERRARITDDPLDIAEAARRLLSPAQKTELLDALWAVASADGNIHEFEEGLIARVSAILKP